MQADAPLYGSYWTPNQSAITQHSAQMFLWLRDALGRSLGARVKDAIETCQCEWRILQLCVCLSLFLNAALTSPLLLTQGELFSWQILDHVTLVTLVRYTEATLWPYKIRFIFSQIPFDLFPDFMFVFVIYLFSFNG